MDSCDVPESDSFQGSSSFRCGLPYKGWVSTTGLPDACMSTEELDIDMQRFGDFDQLDLLDLIEGTMSADRAKVLVETVREKDPQLLHKLVRMQADRIEMASHHTPPTPENLFAKVRQLTNPNDTLPSDFPEAVEPTLMMERSLKNLGRTRRRRQRPPREGVAQGLAPVDHRRRPA